MMRSNKVKEDIYFEHDADGVDSLVVKNTFSADRALADARLCRDAGKESSGDNKLIATLPMELITLWLKEAGVSWSDSHACEEVVKRNLLDPKNSKFRVWEGNY